MERLNMATAILMLPFLVLVIFGCAEAQQEPLSAKEYCNRGVSYFEKGQYDKAISDYNKALEIDPGFAKAILARGVAYYYKGEYDKASADVHKVQSLGHHFPPAFIQALRQASGRQE